MKPVTLRLSLLPCLVLVAALALHASAQRIVQYDPAPGAGGQPPVWLPSYKKDVNPAPAEGKPMIQLALLLDTSSSMDGLIAQAKGQLWSMVNAFVKVKKDGVRPNFQVALYEYGRNSLDRNSGFVRKVVNLTDNLDEVSEKLMALQATRISGSDERCGWVLHRAVQELGWSGSAEDLKVICIAGNESFAQGNINFKIPCDMAVRAGISINTIYCGNYAQGEQLLWKMGAQLGGGSYSAIDHNISTRTASTPQDSKLRSLNAALNRTYVPYTDYGLAAQQRQELADSAAQNIAPATLSERANLKASRLYKTSDWDLVEASQDNDFDLAAVPANVLPETMQSMSIEERRAHLAQLAKQRDEIKKQITTLSDARTKYLAAIQQSQLNTLDKAVVDSLKAQAEKKKFVPD